MLQIISGKFYRSDIRHHHEGKGILYSNISWPVKIETTVFTMELVDHGKINTYIIYYDNQLEKSNTSANLVKVGDIEIVKQIKVLCSFALNAFFDEDRSNVVDLCRQYAIKRQDSYNIPSDYVHRTLDIGLCALNDEIENLQMFINKIIGLPRIIYKAIINYTETYNKAIIALDNDLYLAYSMLVYCLESISQLFDNHKPNWEDYDQTQKNKLEICFESINESTALMIKNILLESDQQKLTNRFINFTMKNLQDDFFIEHVQCEKVLQKSELKQALLNAYKIRSKYVHALEILIPQLRVPSISKKCEVFEFSHDVFLTFSGLQRIVRTVIREFINKQNTILFEDIDWRNELPGTYYFELAPQYWIWQDIDLQPEHIKSKYEGLLSIIVSGEKKLPDMRKVINRMVKMFKSVNPETMILIYCIYKIYNSFVTEEYRSENHTKFLSENESLLQNCCIEVMALNSLPISFNTQFEWELITCEEVINNYNKKKFNKNSLKLPSLVETIISIQMANAYMIDKSSNKQKEWLNNALLNCSGNCILQSEIIKTIESLGEFDIQKIYNMVYQI